MIPKPGSIVRRVGPRMAVNGGRMREKDYTNILFLYNEAGWKVMDLDLACKFGDDLKQEKARIMRDVKGNKKLICKNALQTSRVLGLQVWSEAYRLSDVNSKSCLQITNQI